MLIFRLVKFNLGWSSWGSLGRYDQHLVNFKGPLQHYFDDLYQFKVGRGRSYVARLPHPQVNYNTTHAAMMLSCRCLLTRTSATCRKVATRAEQISIRQSTQSEQVQTLESPAVAHRRVFRLNKPTVKEVSRDVHSILWWCSQVCCYWSHYNTCFSVLCMR